MEKAVLIEMQPTGLRMITEKLMGGAFHKKIDEISDTIRFDDEIFEKGEISDSMKMECLRVLKVYKELCEAKGIMKIMAIASSIFANVRNAKNMFEDISKMYGFNFNVLSEEEELKATYNGLIGTVEHSKGVFLQVNQHNTYIVSFAKRSLISYNILHFGAGTLAKKFITNESADPKKVVNEIVDYVRAEIKALNLDFSIFEEVNFIGSGNIFLTLSKLCRKITHYPLDYDNNYNITPENFEKALGILQEQGFDKTKRLAGISNERLDILMAGFAIIKAFAYENEVENFCVAMRGVAEAFISNKIVRENTCESTSNDQMEISLENIKYYYQIDESNADNIYNLTLELYRQMSIIHKLTRKQVRSLKVASYLYDCGKRISFENHTKYSKDVILNAGILNITHKDLVVAAFACQCQNLDNFSLAEWVKYKDIVNEEDLINARKIGVLVALASALDCGKQNKIEEINCDLLGDIVIIKAKAIKVVTYEISEANKVLNSFKKVFKKTYQIM